MSEVKCIVCGAQDLLRLADITGVPIHCNLLYASETAARAAARGDMRLSYCRACGHVFNRAFDPSLTAYGHDYETSLHASPRFQRYAEDLADHLIERYGITGKTVIEIGCGRGEFLAMVCAKGDNRGIGFDKSYAPASDKGPADGRITFVADYYDENYADEKPDLVCCRHVLEHVEDPGRFLAGIHRTLGGGQGTILYFEVPNAAYMLETMGVWDLIYEHCSYFSEPSLRRAFARSGFEILASRTGFAEQFLCLEARPAADAGSGPAVGNQDLGDMESLVRAFPDRYRQTIDHWRSRLAEFAAAGRDVALWGAGSKGVTFLNVFRPADEIPYVVDLNPRKHGKYVPGVGRQILAPQALRDLSPSVIIVMNPVYRTEVQAQVADLGLSAEVVSV